MLVARILLLFHLSFVYSAPANSTIVEKNCNSTEELLRALLCAVMSQEYTTKITMMLDMNVEVNGTEVTQFLDSCKNYTNCLENSCESQETKNDVYFTCASVKVFRSKFKKCVDLLTETLMTSNNMEKYDCKGIVDYKPDGSDTDFFTKEKGCVVSIMNDVCEKGSTDNYDKNVAAFTEIVQVSKLLKPGVHAPKLNITFSD